MPPTTALCNAPYTVPPHAYRRAFSAYILTLYVFLSITAMMEPYEDH